MLTFIQVIYLRLTDISRITSGLYFYILCCSSLSAFSCAINPIFVIKPMQKEDYNVYLSNCLAFVFLLQSPYFSIRTSGNTFSKQLVSLYFQFEQMLVTFKHRSAVNKIIVSLSLHLVSDINYS